MLVDLLDKMQSLSSTGVLKTLDSFVSHALLGTMLMVRCAMIADVSADLVRHTTPGVKGRVSSVALGAAICALLVPLCGAAAGYKAGPLLGASVGAISSSGVVSHLGFKCACLTAQEKTRRMFVVAVQM